MELTVSHPLSHLGVQGETGETGGARSAPGRAVLQEFSSRDPDAADPLAVEPYLSGLPATRHRRELAAGLEVLDQGEFADLEQLPAFATELLLDGRQGHGDRD